MHSIIIVIAAWCGGTVLNVNLLAFLAVLGNQWERTEVPGLDHGIDLPVALEGVDGGLPVLVVDVQVAFLAVREQEAALKEDLRVARILSRNRLLGLWRLELNLHEVFIPGAQPNGLYLVVGD